jgi:hypothetical protein
MYAGLWWIDVYTRGNLKILDPDGVKILKDTLKMREVDVNWIHLAQDGDN